MTTYFAIQHIPTGRFLPNPTGRGGRGGTHVEFGDPGTPRLFATEAGANQALRWWLGGKVTVGYRVTGDFVEDVDEDWHTEPCPHRNQEEVRVVPVTLGIRNYG